MGFIILCCDSRKDAYSNEEEHHYIRDNGLDLEHIYRDMKN